MTCSVCNYEWCWLCGMPYKSVFHYFQAGGLICEMLAGSFFRKKPCCSITLLVIVFITLPLIIWFFSCLIVAALVGFGYEKIMLKTNTLQDKLQKVQLFDKDFQSNILSTLVHIRSLTLARNCRRHWISNSSSVRFARIYNIFGRFDSFAGEVGKT